MKPSDWCPLFPKLMFNDHDFIKGVDWSERANRVVRRGRHQQVIYNPPHTPHTLQLLSPSPSGQSTAHRLSLVRLIAQSVNLSLGAASSFIKCNNAVWWWIQQHRRLHTERAHRLALNLSLQSRLSPAGTATYVIIRKHLNKQGRVKTGSS